MWRLSSGQYFTRPLCTSNFLRNVQNGMQIAIQTNVSRRKLGK
jgi:hypothetical protein